MRKENYKKNKVINEKTRVNFRNGAMKQEVNTWTWKYLHPIKTKHSTCCNVGVTVSSV